MSGSAWGALILGAALGTLGAVALDQVQARAQGELEGRLAVADNRLRELGAVKQPVDAYERARARFEAQVRWIDEERARQRCPGLVIAGLELERRASTIEAVALEGATLALVGRADSDAELDALAASVRGASWTRAVRKGSARAGDGPGRRFGLLVTLEQPPCPPPGESQVASSAGGR